MSFLRLLVFFNVFLEFYLNEDMYSNIFDVWLYLCGELLFIDKI